METVLSELESIKNDFDTDLESLKSDFGMYKIEERSKMKICDIPGIADTLKSENKLLVELHQETSILPIK